MIERLLLPCLLAGVSLGDNTLFFVPHNQEKHVAPLARNFSCPDLTQCPTGNTCCGVGSRNQYGCCPYANAVCCSDGIHCCQRGTSCHPEGNGCVHGNGETVPKQPVQASSRVDLKAVLCPDKEGMCPHGETCCQGTNLMFACCPFKQGVCCEDKVHCCPGGMTCHLGASRCVKGQGYLLGLFSLPLAKTTVQKKQNIKKEIICPYGELVCPGDTTCCKQKTGRYGCCQYPNAVCCSDEMHCCPTGYTCELSSGTCSKEGHIISWAENIPGTESLDTGKIPTNDSRAGDIHCDRDHECNDGDTCCMMENHQWGCCPMPKAVCCSDHAHCCPHGTTCDMPHGQCKKPDGTALAWSTKKQAKKVAKKVANVKCDSTHECPDGSTCCKLSSGQWGCCPIPQAVCCSDHQHCCPSGTTCDTAQGKCNKQDGTSVEWLEKNLALSRQVENVKCDSQYECPDGTTCCKMSTGQWGCCPIPNAVCCSDHQHCCPSGTTCDTAQGKCNRGDGTSVEWLEKNLALSRQVENVKCDSQYECPDGTTCCKMSTGQWGCCPIPNAVCCSDHQHCCPSGTTCDTAQGKCNRQDGTSVEWFIKHQPLHSGLLIFDSLEESKHRPQKINHELEKTAVTCQGGDVQCPGGFTCCQMMAGKWGCCPFQKAVCCSDQVHCCPEGMTCDASSGSCNKDGLSFTWLDKKPAFAKKVQTEVEVLPDSEDAVSLDSDNHVSSVACNSAGASCPDNHTCCPIDSTQFGCCPLPQGVCCPDHVHCCPQHSVCNMQLQKCIIRGTNEMIDWVEKKPSRDNTMSQAPLETIYKSHPFAVMCPDGHSECPDGATCCKLVGGQYGCCPLPDAVCCSDDIHCCPSGTTCDLAHGRCSSGDGTHVQWVEKTPHLEVVKCDTQYSCPNGNTCCKTASGQWGCCPIAMAVCCSDHQHCCPSGTTCDTAQGKCNRQDGTSVEWLEKNLALSRQVENVKCDSQYECPDGTTCCKMSTGQWGCCPIPNAVCCSDHQHCCPSGTTCDTAQGKCNRGDGTSVEWLEKNLALSRQVENVKCDSQYECPDGTTCCKMSTGQWGCCPIPNAVCCSDHQHCCPSGTTCDTAQGKCNRQDGTSVEWLKKEFATYRKPGNVQCDSTYECPDGSTCCRLSTGEWGCCPLEQAVCCTDGQHCCPKGTTCAVSEGKCKQQDGTFLAWFEKTASISKDVHVPCDSQYACPDGNTCCKLSTGQWGCCPLPQAVCCKDNTHCCPNGMTCNAASGSCDTDSGESFAWLVKRPAIERQLSDIFTCNGTKRKCVDGQTCCKNAFGQEGCCVFNNGVCCSDGSHCCPEGTTCDTESGHCLRKGFLSAWSKHRLVEQEGESDVPCGSSTCPDGSTCCKLSSGAFGCCPLPNAVCCSDHQHCCPSGTTCDTAQGKCNKQDGTSVEWFIKHPALSIPDNDVSSVACNSAGASCPDNHTCCPIDSTQFGCCPLPQGVCCPDHVHCCPQHSVCNMQLQKCIIRGTNEMIDWVEKKPSRDNTMSQAPLETIYKSHPFAVMCPDGHSECPDGATCCKLVGGQYGCCPLPDAVCCSDDIHCCPSGTTCDLAHGRCSSGDGTHVQWVEKTSHLEVVKCDTQYSCPNGNTCCKTASGQWGCCPIAMAVCCSDHQHCCPSGTTCDTAQGKCNRRDGTSVEWLEKNLALSRQVENVKCDSQYECPDGTTCCKMSTGQWGCCPIPNAVCCSDHQHCCPSGTTCDTAQGKCNRQDGTSVEWLKKEFATYRKPGNVQCDSTYECPDGSTCCRLSTGEWGCCPLAQAVCCTDGQHCCPKGTTCAVSEGKCKLQDGTFLAWFEKTASISKDVHVQCDSQYACPDGNTCCKLSTGQWGCCPLPQAVCCKDNTHCCPNGMTCNAASGSCDTDSGESFAWLVKRPAIERKLSDIFTCNGTKRKCVDGQTCCKNAFGQEGCCVFNNGVCCSDGSHCCPEGTTCDTESGHCLRKGFLSAWSKHRLVEQEGESDVPCGSSTCPDGSTCCKLSSGAFGCCPLPNAVCCSDGEHCCPSGTTCDTAQGKCNRQDGTSVEWFKKTSLTPRTVENIKCDSSHECPDGTTCCKLSTGQWGCCPLPNAVCCSDGSHCCPSGTTCDVGAGSCKTSQGEPLTWFSKHPAITSKLGVFTCNGTQKKCNDGQTCCKVADGHVGCCVYTNGVCCSDGTHCCPSGSQCDVESGQCKTADKTTMSLPLLTAGQAKEPTEVKCDSTHECPDGNTCCQLSGGQWGCCPLPNAVCCSDHIHCCPSGTTCDTAQGKCNRQDGSFAYWLEKTPAIEKEVENVKCDSTHECPDGNTCCQLSGGQWGCCPLPNAVCCSDHIHCCPSGTTCDTAQGKCNRGDGSFGYWLEKTPAIEKKVEMVKCDSTHECPDGNTCCQLSGGQWGCCPLPNAVCCSDHIHCCPSGTTCDTAQGKCNRGDGTSVEWFKKNVAIEKKVENVKCDSTHECPDGNTCCQLSGGQWGCCPLPNAVCCSDHIHCCPSGTTCDTAQGKCNRGDGSSVEWFQKNVAIEKKVEMVKCDSTHECPDGNTCCQLSGGQWGCCPLPNAVCCSDHIHCCPSGTTCDTAQGKCNRGDGFSLTWFKKTPAISKNVGMVKCDSTHECPDGNTCCQLSGGQWGCCPLPNAVCCSDHIHCCPSGTTCDTAQGKCNRGDGSFAYWLEKTPAIEKKVEMVKCDSTHECPDGNTCCQLSGGQWGCCPLPNAVCCSDHIHCCPSGTTCDTAQGKCNRGDGLSMTWFKKRPAIEKKVEMVKCDSTHECPDGNTCCQLSGGQWGCCPLPNAVCCSDHIHCCPSGTTCDTAQGKCNRGDGLSMTWFKKRPAIEKKVEMVKCDSTHECPDGNTCCQLSGGQWGCCPLPNAVCCSDHIHCCPSGTTCDTAQGKCNRGDGSSVEWFQKNVAIEKKEEMVKCDETHECPDGNTCCQLSGGQWGCCPLPNAVCCSDHIHCCPSGTTCDTAQGKCNRGDGTSVEWSKKNVAIEKKVEMVKCDTTHECPDGNTCCQLSGGQWGCCPLPNAVCCSDHIHCCPSGTTCDTAQGKCNRGDGSFAYWLEKTPAIEKKVEMVKCDTTHECPDGNTCCQLSGGQWGCCPLPNAVCCSDHIHCCPSGTTCDTAQGKCNRGDGTSVAWFQKNFAITVEKTHQTVLEKTEDITCTDGSTCPNGSTCCALSGGSFGCCPLKNAKCCPDKVHCCPDGFTCDAGTGTCNKGKTRIPFL